MYAHPTRLLAAAIAACALAFPASSQTGVLDQANPPGGAGCSTPGFATSVGIVWQSQVRAGMSGQLEGVDVFMYGFTNTTINVVIRKGDAWSANPVLFAGTATFIGTSKVFVDASAAGIPLAAGETFVIEMFGDGSLAGILGSNCSPASYPEPLWIQSGTVAPAPFSNPDYRIAFNTYMLPGAVGTEFCFGTGCPCGNADPTAGCANSLGTGAHLEVTAGSASVTADDLVLATSGLPANVNGIVFMGGTQQSTPFNDGIRCAGSPTVRFGIQSSGTAGTMGVSGPAGLKPGKITPGSTWIFQTWYRNPTGPCGKGTNMSNAVLLDFMP